MWMNLPRPKQPIGSSTSQLGQPRMMVMKQLKYKGDKYHTSVGYESMVQTQAIANVLGFAFDSKVRSVLKGDKNAKESKRLIYTTVQLVAYPCTPPPLVRMVDARDHARAFSSRLAA
jgi:hypothetical protein